MEFVKPPGRSGDLLSLDLSAVDTGDPTVTALIVVLPVGLAFVCALSDRMAALAVALATLVSTLWVLTR